MYRVNEALIALHLLNYIQNIRIRIGPDSWANKLVVTCKQK